ncbi:virulence factor BrkB family protein [Serratia sp. AKBS12]|uniref:virulence factor BrkB family protein n=1 Tax=Serratia sp. AKBS12 TaxID=2974597 RepID=UPI002166753C|nr:virulence factor BrkB family protein [Serratia sp. AKBS12]MCS3406461.1 virulence factor BrkB family protein [Serratia sp. AKBS12]HEI8868648.1 virulence factor BrkB family protein [Serratia odorifera]
MSLFRSKALPPSMKPGVTFGRLLIKRIDSDGLTMLAGHLAYVSLLSLVPLITVVFALFSVFPMFSDVSMQLKSFIFNNFMPAAGNVIQRYLEQFVANSNKMTAVGTCGLIVTALLLMSSVDSVLNTIWRSKNKRPMIYSFAVYWMVLTLGPLLVGASMAISSYLLSLNWLAQTGVNSLVEQLLRIFPLILSWVSFWLLYSVVPTVRVPSRDALIGALVAGLLFELGKKGFALYVTMFPSYQLIYGVLAVIPILFLWVYWSWCIVLLGAEITVTLGEYRAYRQHKIEQQPQDNQQKGQL